MTPTSTTMQIERSRFAHHFAAAFAGILPALFGAFKPSAKQEPAASAAEKAAREAADVRRMAQTYARTDPGFAADLYAAAARHEGLHG